MIARLLPACLALMTLTACQTTAARGPDPIQTNKPVVLSAADTKIIQTGVRKSLKDPDSARFDGSFTAAEDSKGVITVCGMVNAKNSYGGYTGSKPFVGILSRSPALFEVAGIGSTEADNYGVITVCKRAGITI